MGRDGRGKGGLIVLIVVLCVFNVLSIGGMFILYQRLTEKVTVTTPVAPAPTDIVSNDNGGTGEKNDDEKGETTKEPLPSQSVQHDAVAAKHVDNLKDEIGKAQLPEGAVATVSIMDGVEYLKLTKDQYAFYYRNDYMKYGQEPYGHVIIENGSVKKEFDWDYSLKAENIKSLLPVIFDWRDNKREQMAFVFKKMDDGEEECRGVHFVTCKDLSEYKTLTPDTGFVNCLSIGGFVETDKETLICIVNDSRKYYISAGKKLTEEEKSGLTISAVNDVRYAMLKERVYVYSKVELKNIGWIGEISSRVTYSTFDIFGNHSNVFYCYAEQMNMQSDDMLVITPVKNYEDTKKTKVSLTGDNGEKMIFFAKEGVANAWQDPALYERNENGYMVYKDPSVYTCWGVDVSRYQTVKDWKKVKEAGFEFALIRMAYRGYGGGTIVTDSSFESHIQGATKAGLDVGVYFFTQAITVAEAVEEAEYIVNAIKKYKITYPVIIDTEFYSSVDARANYMSVKQRTDILKAFCETVKKAGYTPMIYAGTNWSMLSFDRSQLEGYDFWYAAYSQNIDYPYHYEILQYAEDAVVPGINEKVDVNICFKKYK